jgi:hypothetical protein
VVKCIDCQRASCGPQVKLHRQGFARCEKAPVWENVSLTYPRNCGRFAEVDDKTKERRSEFMRKHGLV